MLNRIDKNILLILGWPILLLIINFNWIFTQTSHLLLDPWFYLGYFLNLPEYLHKFSGVYYSGRLPWIVPGYLIYKIFSPTTANYVLHLVFYYASLLSVYFILKILFNRNSALITSLAIGSYIWFLASIGWDYVDGAANTYMLLTMAFLTGAIYKPRKELWLLSGGMAFVAMIFTNLFLVVATPFLLIYFIFLNKIKRNSIFIRDLGFIFLGGVTLTILLGIISKYLGGDFLFFASSVQQASKLISEPNPWRGSAKIWIPSAFWLVLPTIIFLKGISSFIRKQWFPKTINKENFISLIFSSFYIFFAVITLTGVAPLLQYRFYASYLNPFMFLAFGSLMAKSLEKMTRKNNINILLFALICFSVAVFLAPSVVLLVPDLFQLILALSLGFLAFTLLIPNRTVNLYLFLLLYAITNTFLFQKNHIPQSHLRDLNMKIIKSDPNFSEVIEGIYLTKNINPESGALFWYDKNENDYGVYRAISSSYLYGARLLNENFPTISSNSMMNQGKLIVISASEDKYRRGAEELEKDGFKVEYIETRVLDNKSIFFTLLKFKKL